jgi:hypothetical protein
MDNTRATELLIGDGGENHHQSSIASAVSAVAVTASALLRP